MKKVTARSGNTNVRILPNTASRVLLQITPETSLEYIRTTPAHNGFKWYAVKIGSMEGYVRSDVGKIIEIKPGGKNLKYLVIHCTATPEGREITKETIEDWHLKPVKDGGRGWKVVGYSRLISLTGELIKMHEYNENDIVENWEITNGVSGINSVSRHIVYAGGVDAKNPKKAKDTRTMKQKETMKNYVFDMVERYPDILVAGHYHFANKACPSFNVEDWCRSIGIPEKNILKK